MSGSSPLAEAVTASTGTGSVGRQAVLLPVGDGSLLTASISFWLVGPRFEPLELVAS